MYETKIYAGLSEEERLSQLINPREIYTDYQRGTNWVDVLFVIGLVIASLGMVLALAIN